MSNSPLVSVIMPVYNSEKYLSEAINSVINQNYTNWELIIVNDGSVDQSLSIAKTFESGRIKVFSQENKGQCAANNYGYRQSKGDYIKFFDSDDLLSTNILEEQVKIALVHPNTVVSAKWGRFYNDDLSTFKLNIEECWKDMLPVDWLTLSWYKGKSMMQCALFLVPRTIINKVGLWNENLSLINDLEFYTRVLLEADMVRFSTESTIYYRSGDPNSLSATNNRKAIESAFESIRLSTAYLVEKSDTQKTRLSATNVWQSFIYECYPRFRDLTLQAEKKIKQLTKPDLKFPNTPKTQLFQKLFGWKFVKRVRLCFANKK